MTIISTVGLLGAFKKVTPEIKHPQTGDFLAVFAAELSISGRFENGPNSECESAGNLIPLEPTDGELQSPEVQDRPLDELYPMPFPQKEEKNASENRQESQEPISFRDEGVAIESGDVSTRVGMSDPRLLRLDQSERHPASPLGETDRAPEPTLASRHALSFEISAQRPTFQQTARPDPNPIEIQDPFPMRVPNPDVGSGGRVDMRQASIVAPEQDVPTLHNEKVGGHIKLHPENQNGEVSKAELRHAIPTANPAALAKLPDKVTPEVPLEKLADLPQLPETELFEGRVLDRESPPREVRQRSDAAQVVTASKSIQAQPPIIGSALPPDVSDESPTPLPSDRGVFESGFLVERHSNAAKNLAPIDVKQHQQASVAASVGQQLSVAVGQKPDGVTEIALNPEELGRVRFSMRTHEGAIVLIIAAERAETQDLMRKNIEFLSKEFESLGFTDIGFQFQGHDQSNERGGNEEPVISTGQFLEPAENVVEQKQVRVAEDGLDLRL